MAINFVPERGRILICNYDMARVPPEMKKTRRAVVISPGSYNERHGHGPGRCLVVPFSATDPGRRMTPADVLFDSESYECLSVATSICGAVMSVSHDRLDRVLINQRGMPPRFSSERLFAHDMARIEIGLRHAMGTV